MRTGIKIATVNATYKETASSRNENQPATSTEGENDININSDINFDNDGMVLV